MAESSVVWPRYSYDSVISLQLQMKYVLVLGCSKYKMQQVTHSAKEVLYGQTLTPSFALPSACGEPSHEMGLCHEAATPKV